MTKVGDSSGSIQFGQCILNVDKDMHPQVQKVVIWHEAVHAILTHASIDHTEQMVETLAHGIIQLLQDNPESKETHE